MHCDECKANKTPHQFYGNDGELRDAVLIAQNSGKTWRKVMCNDCWEALKSRAFCSISRTNDTFTATTAF